MYGVNVLRDVERVEGNKMKDGYGFICVDLGIFTPLKDQSKTSASIIFYKEMPSAQYLSDINYSEKEVTDDSIMNHRYPNKGYLTLSKRNGKKVSKSGYAVVDTIDALNQYQYISITVKNGCSVKIHIMPMSVKLTKSKPFSRVSVRIMQESESSSDIITVSTYKLDGKGWKEKIYCNPKDILSVSNANTGSLTLGKMMMNLNFNKPEIKEVYIYKEKIHFHKYSGKEIPPTY